MSFLHLRLAVFLILANLSVLVAQEKEHPAQARCLAAHARARALQKQGKLIEAVEHYEQAIALGKEAFGQDQNTATLINNLAGLYHEMGKHAQAEPLYRQALEYFEKDLGPAHPRVASALDNLAQHLVDTGRVRAAVPLFRRALTIREKKLPPTHLDLSVSLNNLASALEKLGEETEAEPLYLRGLKVVEQASGPNDLTVAIVLNNLAGLYLHNNRLDQAEPLLNRALKIRESHLGKDSPLLGSTLQQLAELHIKRASYATADQFLQRALRIVEKQRPQESNTLVTLLGTLAVLQDSLGNHARANTFDERCLRLLEGTVGKEHPEVATILQRLGTRAIDAGQFSEAQTHLERGLAIRQQVEPEGLSCAQLLADLGHLCRRKGEFVRAENLSKQSLAIREKLLPADHPDVAQSLNNLGVLYDAAGRYSLAESYYERSLKISQDRKDQALTAATLNNLGTMYVTMHRTEKALPVLLRCLTLKEEVLGKEHPSVAITLDNLAGLYDQQGKVDEAVAVLTRALKIREARLPADHPAIAVTLHNLAEMAMGLGNIDMAATLFERSLTLSRAKLGDDHPMVATSLNYLAHTYLARKEYAEAEKHLLRSLEIRQARLPENHPEKIIALNYLADLYAITGRWELACTMADRSRRIQRVHTAQVLPFLPEPEQLNHVQRYRDSFDSALSIALHVSGNQRMIDQSAAWVLNSKGTIQQALAERSILAGSRGTQAEKVSRELLDIRTQLATATLQIPAGESATHRKWLADLTRQERTLSEEVGRATGSDPHQTPWIDLARVRQAIPAGAVLIEIVKRRVVHFDRVLFQGARYTAWVIPPAGSGEVRVIDLGDAEPIDAAIAVFRNQIGKASATIERKGRQAASQALQPVLDRLGQLLLQPLREQVGETQRWLLGPDGDLWLVPWAALPIGEGRFAIEKYQINQVFSGRELLATPAKAATTAPVIMADPDFDLRGQNAPAGGTTPSQGDTRSQAVASMQWARLPGTAMEAQAIANRLAHLNQGKPVVYTGAQALESVFKLLAQPRILVMSTHGFFVPDQEYSATASSLAHRGIVSSLSAPAPSVAPVPRNTQPAIENPLLRCGLVLAGANRRDQSEAGSREDGLLTGLEIVGTNLRGTELVVLSACETGLGQVRNAEGVAGLRQAFHLAGAQTVLATLWMIPDIETAELMTSYFNHLGGTARLSKGEALRQAQLAMIESQRTQHRVAHPLYWAAFTLSGNAGVSTSPPLPADVASIEPVIPEDRAPRPPQETHWTGWLLLTGSLVGLLFAAGLMLARRKQLVPHVPQKAVESRPPEPRSPVVPPLPVARPPVPLPGVLCACGARLLVRPEWTCSHVRCPKCGTILGIQRPGQ